MLKFFSKRMNNKKGFTLIELIVVIAILAILALIAIPRIGKFRTNAAISSHNANVRTLESAASMYLAEKGLPDASGFTWTKDGTDKAGTWKGYIAEWPKVPGGLVGTSQKGLDDVAFDVEDDYTVEIKAPSGVVEVTVKPRLIKVATQ